MATPTFLQSKTAASDSSAGTSHVVTFDNAVRSANGTTSPSIIVMMISYDGTTGNLVSSVTDTLGNTYQVGTDGAQTCKASDGAGVNGEMWYAYNVTGGSCTITVTTSSSVKAKLAVAELDQGASVSPLDGTSNPIDRVTARIHTPPSAITQRNSADVTGGGAYTTKRQGMIDVCIGGIAWNDTRTASHTTPWTGAVTLSGGSSNLGVGIERKTSEVINIAPTNSVARFLMSASDTQPAAVMCICFFRDGVATGNSEEGSIDNIEGVLTEYHDTTGSLVYRSSASAPGGGTGGSQYSQAFSFKPRYYYSAVATVSDTYTIRYFVLDGYDDGLGYFDFYYKTFNNEQVGTTLETTDWNVAASAGDSPLLPLGVDPNNFTAYTFSLSKTTHWNEDGVSVVKLTGEGDGLGAGTSNYINVGNYYSNIPMYAQFTLTYPSANRLLASLGAGN